MKSKSISAKWMGALFGAYLLLGAGLAQAAAPICQAPGSPLQTNAMTVILGSPSAQWTAACSSFTPITAYNWKVDAIALACTGATCIVPAANINAVGNYSVTVAANNGTLGAQSSAATLTVTPVMADCLPTYGSVDPINPIPAAPPLTQVTLTANCNPGANRSTTVDGYVWTANNNPIPGANLISAADTAPVITVKLPAEGTQYAVTNNTTVNSAKSPGAVHSGVPSCALELVSPTEGAINSGASAVLLPTCDAYTSIDWYIDIPNGADIDIPSPAGGAVSPAATTAYYVVGNNSYGSSGSNVVTVTVNPPAPALPAIPAPLCSLTAAPLTISVGDSTTLTATCPGATSFTWTGVTTGHGLGTPSFGNVIATPTTSGAKTYTVTGTNGSGTSAAASVIVNVSALPKSACTAITPANPSVTVGSPSPLLTATCNNTPTSYVWKVGTTTLACTGATCTVPAASLPTVGSYNVTVTANNAGGGTGTQAASTAITVSALPLSACTAIAPATVSVVRGSASPALTATCNNSPTSYVWKVGTTTLACTGATCTVPAANLPTATTYTVTVKANNAGGTGTQAASKAITVTTVAVPVCTAIAPATVAVAVGSPSPALTATCNNTPTAWVWRLNGTAITGCGTTASTCTVPAARLPTAGASYTVTVTANNTGGAGVTAASRVITVSSGTPVVCPQTITEVLLDYAATGDTQHLTMNRGKAIAFKFTTDSLVKSGSVQTNQSTAGANVYKFMNLSRNKCDFSYTSMDTRTGCSSTGGTATVVRYTTGAPKAGTCTLQKETTYYANIRNENALPSTATYTTKRGIDTCLAGTCGFVVGIY